MLSSVSRHLRRNLVAYFALLFALSGTSCAAATTLLPSNSVGTRQVINGSLLKKDFKSGSFRVAGKETLVTLVIPGLPALRR